MVSCKQCGMHNSLDSTFCKKCGAAVSDAEVIEARSKLEALVVEGNTAFNEGRTDEAMAISESVLLSDPDSTSALWLKAICHERRNEIGLALECAERIVELNPDSDLDRIRRNHLRNKLSASVSVYVRPDRRIALVGAVAAMVLVACIGILVANLLLREDSQADYIASNQPGTANLTSTLDPNVGKADSAGGAQTAVAPPSTQPGAGVQASNDNNGLRTGPQPGDVPAIGQSSNRQAANRTGQPNLPRLGDTGQLPVVEGGIGPVTLDPSKLQVSGPQPEAKPPVTQGNQDDPSNTFDPNGKIVAQQQNDGEIEINVYNGGSKAAKGGESRNGSEAQRRTAYEAFQLGNYSQAAALFEQALRSGGDPVTLNQRLGQSYERLGQTGNAIEAYRRAVQAGEAALAQGKANPSAIRSAVESSQQALKKLGG